MVERSADMADFSLADWIVIGILLVMAGGAIAHLVKVKKSGAKCAGCSAGENCPGKKASNKKCGKRM